MSHVQATSRTKDKLNRLSVGFPHLTRRPLSLLMFIRHSRCALACRIDHQSILSTFFFFSFFFYKDNKWDCLRNMIELSNNPHVRLVLLQCSVDAAWQIHQRIISINCYKQILEARPPRSGHWRWSIIIPSVSVLLILNR